MKPQTVAKIELGSQDALSELISTFGLAKLASLQTVLRQVSRRLLSEFDTLEFFIHHSLIRKCYFANPPKFAALWKRKASYRIFVQKTLDKQSLHFRVGFEAESFCFATTLYKRLKDPRVSSIDVPISSIPSGYGYSLKNKLEQKLRQPIKRIDLGHTIRFYKPQTKKKK